MRQMIPRLIVVDGAKLWWLVVCMQVQPVKKLNSRFLTFFQRLSEEGA